jgi:hypothetical protein
MFKVSHDDMSMYWPRPVRCLIMSAMRIANAAPVPERASFELVPVFGSPSA